MWVTEGVGGVGLRKGKERRRKCGRGRMRRWKVRMNILGKGWREKRRDTRGLILSQGERGTELKEDKERGGMQDTEG